MEIEKIISVLEETLALLQKSQSSDYTYTSVEDIVGRLETEIDNAKNSKSIDAEYLSFLFAPTGAIQETSIDNGWGSEFLRISEVVDSFTRWIDQESKN